MSNAALRALDTIWTNNSFNQEEELQTGIPLWHCGHIPSHDHLDDGKALWTTRSAERSDDYRGNAVYLRHLAQHPPTKLTLRPVRNLRAANFGSASLLDFTVEHCRSNHSTMKHALRDWMIEHGFDAVIGLNREPTEVVVARPHSVLEVAFAEPLNPNVPINH